MENPGLPPGLWALLDGGLWHATDKEGLIGIAASAEIRVSSANRYKNSLCRQAGAVSLFDFGPAAVDDWNQFNNWHSWFGHEQDARVPIWLSIERDAIGSHLLDAGTAHEMWKQNRSQRFIPGVEACHTGAIALSAISNILLVDRFNQEIHQIFAPDWRQILADVDEFELSLPPPPENGIAERLKRARLTLSKP